MLVGLEVKLSIVVVLIANNDLNLVVTTSKLFGDVASSTFLVPRIQNIQTGPLPGQIKIGRPGKRYLTQHWA